MIAQGASPGFTYHNNYEALKGRSNRFRGLASAGVDYYKVRFQLNKKLCTMYETLMQGERTLCRKK